MLQSVRIFAGREDCDGLELTADKFLSSFASFAGMDQTEPQLTPPQPLIGRTLKQYRIESLLGQGGMGVVYRAQDQRLQRPVALKLLTPEVIADPNRRKPQFASSASRTRTLRGNRKRAKKLLNIPPTPES